MVIGQLGEAWQRGDGGLLWEPPCQPGRDLGGTLITTQVKSSELYIPNCEKLREKLPAEESAQITS